MTITRLLVKPTEHQNFFSIKTTNVHGREFGHSRKRFQGDIRAIDIDMQYNTYGESELVTKSTLPGWPKAFEGKGRGGRRDLSL